MYFCSQSSSSYLSAPMNQSEDLRLCSALKDVQLKSFVESLNGQLEYELLESGANLSVGDIQKLRHDISNEGGGRGESRIWYI